MPLIGHSVLSASAGSSELGLTGSLDIMGDGAPATDGGYIQFDEITAPANPASNKGRLYVADDSGTTTIYFKDSAGTATSLMGGGGSATPGGADTQIQWRDGSSFAGLSGLTYTKGTGILLLTGSSQLNFRDANNFIASPLAAELEIKGVGSIALTGSRVVNTIQPGSGTTWATNYPFDGIGGGTILKYGGPLGPDTTLGGKVYYLSGSGAWHLAQANTIESGSRALLGVAAGMEVQFDGINLGGVVRVPAASVIGNFITGSTMYLDKDNAGYYTFTAPTGSGEAVKILGHGISSDDSGNILMFFNPEPGWIELA